MLDFLFKRSNEPKEFVLSGYSTQELFNQRRPDWSDNMKYASKGDALEVSRIWQSNHGLDSSVEVIELQGSKGNVRAVVDQYGTEDI